MSPGEAVRGFLDAFGVQAHRVPVSEEAQIGLYRSIVADRRVLLLLDNARDAEQVRPLLPGSAHCLTVVTSRNRLASLVITEGAQPLSLDLLSYAEAQQMLVSRIGEQTVAQSPAAADEVIERCARLPLALAIVSARVRANPALTVAAVAKELRAGQGSLDLFAEEDGMANVRAVFSYSYNHLSDAAKDLFRLLGTQPGPDITMDAATSLAGKDSPTARQLLTELVRANLLTEYQPRRFTFHDLLRAYARELANTVDSEAVRAAALRRCLDHYLQSAHQASMMMYPQRDPIELITPDPAAVVGTFTDIDDARTWFTGEHRVLLAAVDHAAASGLGTHAWQLAWAIGDVLDWRGLWHPMVASQSTALLAVQQAGDERGMAHAHRLLGRAYIRLGRWDDAESLLQQAVRLFHGLGDPVGEANSHITLSRIHEQYGRMRAALGNSQQALALFGRAGHRAGQARSLNTVGWYHALLGEYEQAIESCGAALDLHSEIGSRFGQAPAWDSLGYAHQRLGHYAEAVSCFDNAILLYREVGDRYHEADTMIHLADSHAAASAWEPAATTYREALQTLDELNHPAAVDVRPKLKTGRGPTHLKSHLRDGKHGTVGRRGLVLGAGGITGIAWQLGMIQGLLAQGVDVGNADLVVGTSAGSVAGAIVAGKVDLATAASMPVYPGPEDGQVEPDWELGAEAFRLLDDASLDLGEARRAVGELALRARVIDEAEFVAGITRRLPLHDWPVSPHLLIASVDALTGKLATWDASSQVTLDLAIAASCAVPCVFPPVTIGDRRYMDGGVRSGTNADLAAGCDFILAFAPLAPTRLRGAPQAEFDDLREGGSRVELIAPDQAALNVLGPNVLDVHRWEPALAAGRRQAAQLGDRAGRLWTDGD